MEKDLKHNPKEHKKSFLMKVIKANSLLLVLSFFCNISATTYSQSASITLKSGNTSVKELFSEIEEKTNYSILYERGLVDNKTVSINAENQTVEEVLNQALPAVGLAYVINENQIVVVEDTKSKAAAPQAPAQSTTSYTLKGTIVDSNRDPLIGANVLIKGTTDGVITDFDGNFSIKVSRGFTLVVKYIGYSDQEIFITDQQNLWITMEEDATQLQDVVVVGYGTQKKESVVGSVQTIRPTELQVPSSRLSTSFAGRLAGVVAVQRTGEPGADGASFWIRGISTFAGTAAQKPLIIIDGVEVSEGDLNNVEPEVIESFSVLKDATATALYGTRGANGVMIVTTKMGGDLEKPIINARVETTFSTPTKIPKFVDGVSYMNLFNEAVATRDLSSTVPYSQVKIQGTAAGLDELAYPNVDWYNELFNNLSLQEKAVVNIRGGGKKMNYFMNVSIGHESGMLKNRSSDFYSYKNNIDLMRYNFQNNISLNASPTTKISLRLNTQLYDWSGPSQSTETLFGNVMNANPVDFPILYPADDPRNTSAVKRAYVTWGGRSGGTNNSGYKNPMAELVNGYKNSFESTVIANIDLEQKLDFLLKGLEFKALASFKNYTVSSTERKFPGYNQFEIPNGGYIMQNGQLSDYRIEMIGNESASSLSSTFGSSGDRRIYLQAMFDYNRVFANNHSVNLMALYNQDQLSYNNPGDLLSSLANRKQGFAGRLTYAYKYKYLFEANFGYNGSESFAKGHRWGFFPSFALGYNVSQERFWEPIQHIVSNLKIRGSWGLVGNDKTADRFVYLSDIKLQEISYTTGREMNHTEKGPEYTRYGNPNITWEVGEKWNGGIDIQLFNSLNIMFDIFHENRRNIFLTRQSIPNYMGTANTKVYGNLGEVENKGFDLSIDYAKNVTKDFFVSIKGTFTFARNKILNYDEAIYDMYPNSLKVGHSVNQQLMYIADRLFIDDYEVAYSPSQPSGYKLQAGDIKYVNQPDRNGEYDDKINENDQVYYGQPTVPEIVYGFGPSFQYKSWDFSFFFQGVANTSLMMSNFHPFGTHSIRNVLQFIADDYWSETNQDPYAAYPRLSKAENSNNEKASTYWLRNAAFLKLKNVEFGYTYKGFRAYVSGSNLLTFSPFKYWDPEMGGGQGLKYPTQRVFNVGIQLTIN